MNIGAIVKGHINEALRLNSDLSQSRLEICYDCPLFNPKFGGICDSSVWYNPETGDVSVIKKSGYVNGCSCRLQAKTRLPNASCPINKW